MSLTSYRAAPSRGKLELRNANGRVLSAAGSVTAEAVIVIEGSIGLHTDLADPAATYSPTP